MLSEKSERPLGAFPQNRIGTWAIKITYWKFFTREFLTIQARMSTLIRRTLVYTLGITYIVNIIHDVPIIVSIATLFIITLVIALEGQTLHVFVGGILMLCIGTFWSYSVYSKTLIYIGYSLLAYVPIIHLKSDIARFMHCEQTKLGR